jgi:hypothetical protein
MLKWANRALQIILVATISEAIDSPTSGMFGGALLGLIWSVNDLNDAELRRQKELEDKDQENKK